MSFEQTVGFLFNVFCWLIGVAFVVFSVITTARNTYRQYLRGAVEEGLDVKRSIEQKYFEGMTQ